MTQTQQAAARLQRPCPACDGRASRPLVCARGQRIYQCARCHLATWDWPPFDGASFYDESYWKSGAVGKGYADYFSLAQAMGPTHRQRLTWLTDRLRNPAQPPRLLDAGCGPGFFVQAATQAGFLAAGVEISAFAVRFAREQLRQNVWQGPVRGGGLGAGPYDVVTLWDVIEHLPDPAASLRAVRAVTRPGSLLAISTGDISSLVARLSGGRWHLFNLPEHLWFFTKESLRHLLRRAGFEPIQWRYEVGWYTVRYVVERLEAMFGGRRIVSVRLGVAGKLPVPVTLGDVVTVLARSRF